MTIGPTAPHDEPSHDPTGDDEIGPTESAPLAADAEVSAALHAIAHAPPRRPRIAVSPGTSWGPSGRYIIGHRLGRGAMGTVYAATDAILRRTVALKILDGAVAAHDAAHHARMLREAQLAARMEHERIARVYDVGTHEGFAFVAMEYVPGGTLRQWMRDRELTVPQIVEIATQIAEGLAELHKKGVIHRDLKPENVMLTEHGGVKLVDFGLARNAFVPAEETRMLGRFEMPDGANASVGAPAGTPGYMAPEQITDESSDLRVDIFSLGAIIHELVTGKRLFSEPTALAIMAATLQGAPQLCHESWTRVPPRLRMYATRMLAKDPGERFANGSSALVALRELVEDMSPSPVPLPVATSHVTGTKLTPLARYRRPRGWRVAAKCVALTSTIAVSAILADVPTDRPEPIRLLPTPPEMILINVGTIEVGRDHEEIVRECRAVGAGCDLKQMLREVPRGKTRIAPFFLDKDEVTNEEFVHTLERHMDSLELVADPSAHHRRVARRDPTTGETDTLLRLSLNGGEIEYSQRRFQVRTGRARMPITSVSLFGASFYCQARGKRLPTEDEWEAAARGRGDRLYPWGNEFPRCGQVVLENDGMVGMLGTCPPKRTIDAHAVGSSAQDITPEGVRDLGGNVSEWTSSRFVDRGSNIESDYQLDHMLGERQASRVVRGGSWAESLMARTSARSYAPAIFMSRFLGFRCASSAEDIGPRR
jgi:serine/threonine protein kinase